MGGDRKQWEETESDGRRQEVMGGGIVQMCAHAWTDLCTFLRVIVIDDGRYAGLYRGLQTRVCISVLFVSTTHQFPL